jgi:hypothetical protein
MAGISPRRLVAMILVGGSLVAGSVLGGLAVTASDATGSAAEDGAVPGGTDELSRRADLISACIRAEPGFDIVPSAVLVPAAKAFGVELPGGDRASVAVFATDAAAQAELDELDALEFDERPNLTILTLDHVLIAFDIHPSSGDRAVVEGCVRSAALPPPDGGLVTGDELGDCLVAANFEFEDNSEFHPDASRSFRVERDGELGFLFVFDTEGDAARWEMETFADDALVTNRGRVIVEFGSAPSPEFRTDLEGCAAAGA